MFYFVFESNFPSTSPRRAYIWRGDLTTSSPGLFPAPPIFWGKSPGDEVGDLREVFCVTSLGGLYLEGLIHGGAYFRNFTVLLVFLLRGEISQLCMQTFSTSFVDQGEVTLTWATREIGDVAMLQIGRLRVVPHFSSGIVKRAKRERAWKSPHARKGDTRWGERKSLSDNDGDGYENDTLKVNSPCFKLYRAYSISFISSNVGNIFLSWILKDCIKIQEKKQKVVVLFSSPQFHAVDKKTWCTCKVVVLPI